MRKTIFSVNLIFLLCISLVSAATIRVPADAPSIQAGVSSSVDGDTVLVAPGLYNEHVRYFGRAIVLLSESGPGSTIIERFYDAWPLIYFLDGETQSSVIDGFTLRNASSSAIKCVGSSPTIQNCVIENNIIFPPEFDYFGGGITIRDSNGYARIKNNIIRFNDATHGFGILGGGILVNDSYAIIDSNTIYGNIANFGGGIDVHGGSVIIRHNLIYENESEIEGGGILMIELTNSSIVNNTIVDNISAESAGGIVIYQSENFDIRNNIIANNNLNSIFAYWCQEISFGYNCIFGHTDSLFYGFIPETGNISVDPRFWCTVDDDYALHRYSLCIDAGDPSSPQDPDGSTADLGAIAFDPSDHLLNFSLLAPADDSICADPPQFIWHASGDLESGHPVFYRFYIDDNAEFDSPDSSFELDDTVYVFTDTLVRSTQYYWKVKAYTYHADSVYSDETWSFYLNGYPAIPTIHAPDDGVFVDSSSDLFWSACPDPDPIDSVTYTVQVDDDAAFNSPEIDVSGITDMGLVLDGVATVMLGDLPGYENLQAIQTYYWRVCADDLYGSHSAFTDGGNFFYFGDGSSGSYQYLPGDVNMASGAWPPNVIGSDVTYLVNYFRSSPDCPPCLIDNFWLSADANGDCNVIGSDVTWLVNYFRGGAIIRFCLYRIPAWLNPTDLPAEPPDGWPNCETPE